MEAFEPLNGFESAIELLVHAFNEIGRPWTIDVEECFCSDVGRELLAALEDVLHHRDLLRMIVVPGRTPPDAGFQAILSQVFHLEDVLLKISEETPKGFLAPDFQGSADVLEEVYVADLDDTAWEDILCRHAYGIVLVTGDTTQRVVHVFELREELHHGLEVLRGSEQADGNIVGDVIHAVDERNLLVVAFHGHILPIDDQRAAEALPIAVPGSDVVVVWQSLQFLYQTCIGRIKTSIDACGERTDARALEMEIQERLLVIPSVIDIEPVSTIIAAVAIDATSRSFSVGVHAVAERTCRSSSGSLFLRGDMLKMGKMASSCYRVILSGARNRTLSSLLFNKMQSKQMTLVRNGD